MGTIMTTPEKKVKDRVKAILKEHGAYFFMPGTHGYGSSGVPDVVGVWHGRMLGIECKSDEGELTGLQTKNLMDIASRGGLAFVVDHSSLKKFEQWAYSFSFAHQLHKDLGHFFDMRVDENS